MNESSEFSELFMTKVKINVSTPNFQCDLPKMLNLQVILKSLYVVNVSIFLLAIVKIFFRNLFHRFSKETALNFFLLLKIVITVIRYDRDKCGQDMQQYEKFVITKRERDNFQHLTSVITVTVTVDLLQINF